MDKAREVCKAAHDLAPTDPRISFLFGRVFGDEPSRREEALKAFEYAASQNYPGGWNNLVFYAEVETNIGAYTTNKLIHGMTQSVFLQVFPFLYHKFTTMSLDSSQKTTVHQFAELAAEFGSAEAHLALADTEASESERLFHILAAKRLASGRRLDDQSTARFVEADDKFQQLKDSAQGQLIAAKLSAIPGGPKLEKLPDGIVNDILHGLPN